MSGTASGETIDAAGNVKRIRVVEASPPGVFDEVADLGCDARVASGGGRMRITMDRYNADWDMVRRAVAA